ncbi:MAG: cupin domain-containing protein [Saprospiraceae bacterium]|nr:cupin domain-containing protein [Saprospiraceae bacterium]
MKQIIDLPLTGETLAFNDAREQTKGQRSEGIVTIAAGKKGPGAHKHMLQTEGFEVISGCMIARVNGVTHTAHPGETILVQPGESHSFINGSATEPLVAKFWYEPALNTEEMLQVMGEEAMRRGGSWEKMPLLPCMHLFFLMRREYRFSGIPHWLQDVIFGFASALARVTGAARKMPMHLSARTVRQGQVITVN